MHSKNLLRGRSSAYDGALSWGSRGRPARAGNLVVPTKNLYFYVEIFLCPIENKTLALKREKQIKN